MKCSSPFNIAFSDESIFAQDLNLGKIWRERGETIPEGFVPTKAHAVCCMFWACIAYNFKSEIIPLEGNVNSEKYIQMLDKSRIFTQLEATLGRDYLFMHDGAPSHKSMKTLEYLSSHGVPLLPNWPALSPDLNPFEHLWSFIKKMLKGKRFNSKEDLIAAVRESWHRIPIDLINYLISSWTARLIICERICGACLNGHWGDVHMEHQKIYPYSFCKTQYWPF